jgi:hypothetical protein
MSNRNAFLDHTYFTLAKASNWRHQQIIKFPGDPRNKIAAQRLSVLCETDDVSGETWNRIRPFFDPEDSHYYDALTRSCRAVGFRTNPRTLDDFFDTVLDGLAVSA